MRLDERIVRRERLELVGRRDKGQARLGGDLRGDARVEARDAVEARADGGAALREHVQPRQHRLHAQDSVLHLRRIAAELLPQRQGRRILRVRAADLDDAGELGGLGLQARVQVRQARQQRAVQHERRGDVHRRREGVIAGHAHVDVVVRVHRLLGAQRAAQQLDGAVGDDLIHVHVRLRARAGLEDDEREVLIPLASDDLIRHAQDGATHHRGHDAILHVDLGGALLEDAKG